MDQSYPNNCKECYNRIMGTCSLWRQVRVIGCNRHPNCPADEKAVHAETESEEK